jgi:hypothetical protein
MEFASKENNGFFTGLYYVFCNAANILTPILSGVFMDINYSLLMPYSLVFIVLAFVTMLFVKHGNEKKGLYIGSKPGKRRKTEKPNTESFGYVTRFRLKQTSEENNE